MKLTTILIWLVVSTTVLGLGHLYLQRRLIRDSALPERSRRWLTGALWFLLLTQPLSFALTRVLPRDVWSPFAYVVFGWMGLFSTLICLLALHDLVRAAFRVFGRFAARTRADSPSTSPSTSPSNESSPAREPRDPERRLALQRWTMGAISLAGLGVSAWGAKVALGKFRVVPVEIRLRKLPREFDGFTIVQLSDIHIGPTIGRDFIARMVETANRLRPDMIAITGDLVDGSVEHLGRHAAPLAELSAPHGTWFVTGNHEYYSGADEWIDELARLGIPTLRNRRVELTREGAVVDLVGVTDHRAGQYDDAPDLERALRGRDRSRESILLAHQPVAVKEASQYDIGLQLSGHTHGGQFWPWSWVVNWVQPVARGWARFGETQIWVNTGTGYWGPPLRTGSEPEITLLTLRAQA